MTTGSNTLNNQASFIEVPLEATLASRSSTHGDFIDNAEVSQAIKYIITQQLASRGKLLSMPSDMREALDMIAHKLARIVAGDYNYIDHWHDIQGYAKLVERRLIKEQR